MDPNKKILENIITSFEQCQQNGQTAMLVYCNDAPPYTYSIVGVDDSYSPWYAHDYLKIDDPQKHYMLLMALDLTKPFEEQYDHSKTQDLNDPEMLALDPLICIPDRKGTNPNGKYDTLTELFEKTKLKAVVNNKHLGPKEPSDKKANRPRPDYLRLVK